MSIVAMSETVGSGGIEIGRALAGALGWEFADREIITKAAESFGGGVMELKHASDEKPTLWDRFRHSQRRYMAYIEAIVLEMAARGNVVLVGRASTIILGEVSHALRIRVIAPERTRAERIEREQGLTSQAAAEYVQAADRDLAARVRFLYQLDWEDPLLYDLVLNTERLSVGRAVSMLQERLRDERFAITDLAGQTLRDRSLVARARAVLLADPATRPRAIDVTVAGSTLELTGHVESETESRAAERAVARIPGVVGVHNRLVVTIGTTDFLGHGQFRHGEERRWGGYGSGWYEREPSERERDERDRRP